MLHDIQLLDNEPSPILDAEQGTILGSCTHLAAGWQALLAPHASSAARDVNSMLL